MDPNVVLRKLREAMDAYAFSTGQADPEGMAKAAEDMADYAEALDGWLTDKGFMPRAWARPCVHCGAEH